MSFHSEGKKKFPLSSSFFSSISFNLMRRTTKTRVWHTFQHVNGNKNFLNSFFCLLFLSICCATLSINISPDPSRFSLFSLTLHRLYCGFLRMRLFTERLFDEIFIVDKQEEHLHDLHVSRHVLLCVIHGLEVVSIGTLTQAVHSSSSRVLRASRALWKI